MTAVLQKEVKRGAFRLQQFKHILRGHRHYLTRVRHAVAVGNVVHHRLCLVGTQLVNHLPVDFLRERVTLCVDALRLVQQRGGFGNKVKLPSNVKVAFGVVRRTGAVHDYAAAVKRLRLPPLLLGHAVAKPVQKLFYLYNVALTTGRVVVPVPDVDAASILLETTTAAKVRRVEVTTPRALHPAEARTFRLRPRQKLQHVRQAANVVAYVLHRLATRTAPDGHEPHHTDLARQLIHRLCNYVGTTHRFVCVRVKVVHGVGETGEPAGKVFSARRRRTVRSRLNRWSAPVSRRAL